MAFFWRHIRLLLGNSARVATREWIGFCAKHALTGFVGYGLLLIYLLSFSKIPINEDDFELHKGNWSYVAFGDNSTRPFLNHLASVGFFVVDHHQDLLSAVKKHSFFGVEIYAATDDPTEPRLSYKIYGLRRELKNLRNDWDILSNPLSARTEEMMDSVPLFAMKFAVDAHYKDWILDRDNATIDERVMLVPLPDVQRSNGAIEFMEGKATFSVMVFEMALLILLVTMARETFSEKVTGMRAYLGVMGVCRITIYMNHMVRSFCAVFFHSFALFLCLVAYLNVSVAFLTLITIFLYSIATASFIMLLTAFFRSEVGLIVGTIVCWVGSIYLPTDNAYFNFGKAMAMAFSPNVALQYSFRSLAEQYVFDGENYAFTYAFSYAGLLPMWSMFIMHTVIVTVVGLFLEAVLPVNDCPTVRPLDWLKRMKVQAQPEEVKTSGDMDCLFPWEMIYRTMDDCDVTVNQLSKQFCKSAKPSVDRFTFRAYRNEVTVLVGHNGAGKSTAFNVMCGIEKPTSGKVEICGKNIVTDLTACRANISYCPQTNPIFRSMTVKEHLLFFKALKSHEKSTDPSGDNRQVMELMKDLDIEELADKKACKLSGGQLRKLCIGIALAGNSPVVLLDEPTAGVDTVSRKTIDEVIYRCKKGRTIILTTHYMDEAENVGDRIAIMAKGRLCTYGSPEFLKRKFGDGYVATIELEDPEETGSETSFDQRAQAVQDFITQHVPLTKFIKGTGIENRIMICLPFEGRPSYAKLFGGLEEQKVKLEVRAYTLHLNTLEQVFLAVGELVDDTSTHPKPAPEKVMDTLTTCLKEPRTCGLARFGQQLSGLVTKRCCYIYQSPNPKVTLVSLVFPVLFVLIALVVCNGDKSLNSIVRVFEKSTKCFGMHIVEIAERSLPSARSLHHAIPRQSTVKRIWTNESQHYPHLPPVAFGFLPPSKPKKIPRILFNPSAFHSVFFALNVYGNARLDKKDAIEFAVESLPEKFDLEYIAKTYIVPVVVCFSLGMSIAGSIVFLNEERRSSFQSQQFLTRTFKITYWMCQLFIDLIIYAVAASIIGSLLLAFDYSVYSMYPAGLFTFLFLYFFAFAPLIYSLSHVFSSPTKAYLIAVLFDIMISFATNVITLIAGLGLMFIDPEKGFTIVQYAQYFICVLSPTSALQHGIMTLGIPDHPNESGFAMLFLGTSMTIYTITLVMLESRAIRYVLARNKGETIDPDKWDALSMTSVCEDVLKDVTTVREFPEKCSAVLAMNLYKSYEQTPVVKGLNFYVKRGECFALLGKNGAGKTTTFKMVTGEASPEEGTITIDGNKTQSALTDIALGYCPQSESFLPQLTSWQNMVVMAKLSGIKHVHDCVKAVLYAVDLWPDAMVKSGVLSGGQKRRLSVAMSILAELPVVLLDEPTTGIDPVARHLIWKLLSTIRNQGMSVVMTSHDMDECEAICSRVSFMRYGAVVATGSPCHLINLYSPGFGVKITVQDPSPDAFAYFNDLMQATLKADASFSAEDAESYQWEVPKDGERQLARIFDFMENLAESHKSGADEKAEFFITDYTVESNCLQDVVTILSHSSRESLWMLGNQSHFDTTSSMGSTVSDAFYYPEPTEREIALMKKRMSIFSQRASIVSDLVSPTTGAPQQC